MTHDYFPYQFSDYDPLEYWDWFPPFKDFLGYKRNSNQMIALFCQPNGTIQEIHLLGPLESPSVAYRRWYKKATEVLRKHVATECHICLVYRNCDFCSKRRKLKYLRGDLLT